MAVQARPAGLGEGLDAQALALVFHGTSDAVVTVDAAGRVRAANRAALELFGYRAFEELVDRPVWRLLPPASQRRRGFLRACLGARRHDGADAPLRLRARRRDGSSFCATLRVIDFELDGRRYVTAFVRRKEAEPSPDDKLHRALHYDLATGLPNRRAFETHLAQLFQHLGGTDRFLLVEFGIDSMRDINSTFGQQIGDRVIAEAGRRLKFNLAPYEFLARSSADRFSAILRLGPRARAEATLKSLENRLADALSAPFDLDGGRAGISITAGAVEVPALADSAESAAKAAEMAFFEAKANRRGGAHLLVRADLERVSRTAALVHRMREAIQAGEFFALFQPKIDLVSGRCQAAEALARWRAPDGRVLLPDLFIPVAERADLVEGIGRFMLLESIAAARAWQDDPALRGLKVAVNVSPRQLERPNFVPFVADSLTGLDLDPGLLELEITETALMRDPDRMRAKLTALMDMGLSIAIDDFGIGNSSLGILARMPASRAKLDHSFLTDVLRSRRRTKLLGNAINLAKDLGLAVTVEGVETEAILAFLRGTRCDEVQGFLFSKPVGRADFEAFARRWNGALDPAGARARA